MQNEKSLKVVILKPQGKPYVSTIVDKLENLQRIVGGLIDVVALDDEIGIVINGEGKLEQLRPNIAHPFATDEWFDVLVGNCIFVSHDGEGNFVSLNRKQIARVFEKVDELRFALLKHTYEVMKKKFQKHRERW